MANGLPELHTQGIGVIAPALKDVLMLKHLQQQGQLDQAKIQQLPEEQAFLAKKREFDLQKLKFTNEDDAIDYLYKSTPLVNYDNYTESKKHFEELGIKPGVLPDIESFGEIGSDAAKKKFQQFKINGMVKLADQIAIMKAGKGESPIGKMQDDLAKETDPARRAEIQAAIQKAITGAEPKGDFETFKAGVEKQSGETTQQFNARVSAGWHKQKEAESTKIIVAGAEARGKAFQDEKYFSMFDTEIGKTIRIKGKILNEDSGKQYPRFLDPQDPNVKADAGSLAKLTKGMDSVAAFDIGAKNSLDYAQSVAKDFGLGKYPQANKVSQLFQYHLGDPKVKGLKNAITTAATEYMKVINAGSDLTAAELSVMGQQRAKEIIEAADNFESLKNSITIMKNEADISANKFNTQRKAIQTRLRGYGAETPIESVQSKATHRYIPGQGIVEIK